MNSSGDNLGDETFKMLINLGNMGLIDQAFTLANQELAAIMLNETKGE